MERQQKQQAHVVVSIDGRVVLQSTIVDQKGKKKAEGMDHPYEQHFANSFSYITKILMETQTKLVKLYRRNCTRTIPMTLVTVNLSNGLTSQ
jgi:hypothetical protein